MEQTDLNDFLFTELILELQQKALIGMGKMKNLTSEVFEKNLPIAKLNIDFLEILLLKTEGSRTNSEDVLLKGLISDCKMNYLEEIKLVESTKSILSTK